MTYLQLAAHVFLLLFWTRFWTSPAREFYFNPFLSGTTRFMDTIIGALRPALMLPERLAALLLLAFFWAFQTMFVAQFGEAWRMTFGLVKFTVSGEDLSWGMHFAYSGLYSAHVLAQAWTVYFLVRLISPPGRPARAQEAFTFFMRPFSWLSLPLQPVILLALHFALAFAVVRTGAVPCIALPSQEEASAIQGAFTGGPALSVLLLKTGGLAVMSFVSGLQTLIHAMVFSFLIGILLMISGMKTPALFCRESSNMLMGRFARKSVTTGGGIDFTPIIFIIVVNEIGDRLLSLLYHFITAPL